MGKKPSFPEDLISLKKASEISGYHPDYLSYLIRKGKIRGKRVGRDWFTTEEAVKNYLSTKKFLPIKDILFSKVSPKMIFALGVAAILIGIAAFLIINPPAYFQQARGDFSKKELQTENVGPVKVTTYSSDEAGGIEISIQSQSGSLLAEKEPSLFQKILDFLRK